MKESADGLAKLSIIPGLVGPILYVSAALTVRLGLLRGINLPNGIVLPLLFGSGGAALALAVIALVRIIRGRRHGVIWAVAALLLGAFGILFGLALIAVSHIQVLPSNQPFL